MRLLPWRRETRASTNYSSVVQDAILAAAEGRTAASPMTTAALGACADFNARAMAQAVTTPVIPPSVLYDCARDMSLHGEYVALFEMTTDGPTFTRASSHDVRGGHRPEDWTYTLWLAGPTTSTRVQVPRDRVAHVVLNSRASSPWRGRSPIAAASTTGRLLSELERALGDEASGPVGSVVPSPEGEHKVGKLQRSLNALRGRLVFAQTVAGGYGDRGAAPMTDWKAQRLGPSFTAAEISLRDAVERTVCGLYGQHPVLHAGTGDGTLAREAYRRFQRATLEPYARLISEQFGRVLGLGRPGDVRLLTAEGIRHGGVGKNLPCSRRKGRHHRARTCSRALWLCGPGAGVKGTWS